MPRLSSGGAVFPVGGAEQHTGDDAHSNSGVVGFAGTPFFAKLSLQSSPWSVQTVQIGPHIKGVQGAVLS